MKIYNSEPEGNESADLEPALYFNTAIEQIVEIEKWMRDATEPAQAMLVHIDIFLLLAKRYPDMAQRRVAKLNVSELKETFDKWYERCNAKIPKQFRTDIKKSADRLFNDLDKLTK